MAITLTITVGAVSGSDWQTATSYTQLNLRASPYSAATYNQNSHLGDGVYDFLNVASGEYKLYNNTTELTKFGIIKVGEDGAVLMTGNQTIAGTKTFSAAAVFTSGFQTNTISERTAGSGVTIDSILLKDDLPTSLIAGLEEDNDFIGANTFTGQVAFEDLCPTSEISPTVDAHLTRKDYVDDLVAGVTVSPYQIGANSRRVIYGATEVTNQIYNDVEGAVDSCTSPDDDNRFNLFLENGQNDATNNQDNIFYVSHNDLANYCNLIGYGLNSILVLGVTGASQTKTMDIENCTIFFGINDINAARTYNSFRFRNCNIYAYHNTTFTNCLLDKCNVFHPSGKAATVTGTTDLFSCNFTQTVTYSTHTGNAVDVTDEFNTSYTMPTDLSLTP